LATDNSKAHSLNFHQFLFSSFLSNSPCLQFKQLCIETW